MNVRLAAVVVLLVGLSCMAPTAFATGSAPRCEPRSAAEWASKCLTPDGRDSLERLLPDVQRWRLFADVNSVGDACAILRPGSADTDCERARRQLFAALLNHASGRLGPDCCVETPQGPRRLRDVFQRDEESCRARRDCATVRDRLARLNSGDGIVRCDDAGPGPRPGGDDDCCRPRSKGFWHRQCLGIGALTPGRGQGGGPGLHPAFTEDRLREIIRRANRRMGSRCENACQALDEANYRTAEGRARAQYAALVLNREAGFLDGCDGDGALRRVERLMDDGRWDEAKSAAEAVNVGQSVRRCGGDRDDDRDRDHDRDRDPGQHGHHPGCGHDDHDHDGHDHDRDKDKDKDKGHGHGHGHGHGKDKGKGKP